MSKKILLVDDDVTSLKLMQVMFEKNGYTIVLARDGDVGLERAQKDTPDLIVLDVDMPRMNGYFFVGEIKKVDALKDIPIIIVTSFENMQQAFANKGIKDYIIKPVDFPKLLNQIDALLN